MPKFSISDAAKRAGVERTTLYRKLNKGEISANPLARYLPGWGRALTKRRAQELQPAPEWDTDEEAGRWEPPTAAPEYRPPQPEFRPPPEPQPQPKRPETITAYEVVTEHHHDNSLSGLFHGKTNFWFALCVYLLGGTLALTVITVVIGEPEFMKVAVGSWAFVCLFLVFWNAKNLTHDSGKWIARLLIVIIILSWIGAATHGH